MKCPRGPISILALVLALGTTVAGEQREKEEEEEIHVCKDRNGETVYQSYPCPEVPAAPPGKPTPAQVESRPAAPVKPEPKPATPVKSAAKRAAPVKAGPAAAAPKPLSNNALRPAPAWQLVGRPSADRPRTGAGPATGAVDPRFATPERTWQTFSAAMRDGDRAAARACLTSTALRDLGPLIDSSAPEKLSEFLGGSPRVELEGDVGPFWSLRISRARERPKWIFLVRTEGGEWKIAEI